MASRLPGDDDPQARAAAALQFALAQQVRPLMTGWDPLAALTTMQRNFLELQQQQQQQQHQQQQQQQQQQQHSAPMNLPAPVTTPLTDPAISYLNQMRNPPNTESLVSLQQNLLFLEQIQQQRQLLAAHPHLLMAATAATQSSTPIPPPHQTLNDSQQYLQSLLNAGWPFQNGSDDVSRSHYSNTLRPSASGSESMLANSSTAQSGLTNQHQDSLVDQHFRRSLGEDYNQIMAGKTDRLHLAK